MAALQNFPELLTTCPQSCCWCNYLCERSWLQDDASESWSQTCGGSSTSPQKISHRQSLEEWIKKVKQESEALKVINAWLDTCTRELLDFCSNHRITADNYVNKCRGDRSDRAQFYGLKRKTVFSVCSILVLRKELLSNLSCYWHGTVS